MNKLSKSNLIEVESDVCRRKACESKRELGKKAVSLNVGLTFNVIISFSCCSDVG